MYNHRMRRLALRSAVPVTFALILAAGAPLLMARASDEEKRLLERLKEYSEVLEATSYWSPQVIPEESLVYSSIRGMMTTLDPHSTFLEPKNYDRMRESQSGSYFGVGLLVTQRNDRVTVVSAHEGAPASRVGVRAGDVISHVDGVSTSQIEYEEVVRRLKGPRGTTVEVNVLRAGSSEPIPFTITRAAIETNSVPTALIIRPGVGYIRITDFTETTGREFETAITDLRTKGMKRLVLDLRGNGGGLLDAAIAVTDHFVGSGEMIVYTKGRARDAGHEYLAPGRYPSMDLPLVVLIDHGSASASEIVAGAIQDHDRGLVVGQTSWGKGLVQSVYTLPYEAGLALTTSRYYTPSGRNIQRDYTSLFDYFVANPEQETPADLPTYVTATGRKVAGGGGITPDVEIPRVTLSRATQRIEAAGILFDFGVELARKAGDDPAKITVTDEMYEQIRERALERSIVSREVLDGGLAGAEDQKYLKNALLAEIIAARFGYRASYPARVGSDPQITAAANLLGEAEKLARRSREAAALVSSSSRQGSSQ